MGEQRQDASLAATLAGIGAGLQFVPIVGNVIGGSLLGASVLLAGTEAGLGAVGTTAAIGSTGAAGAILPGESALVAQNVGVPGAKALTLGAKSSVPGQSSSQQTANQIEGVGILASVAVPVAGAAGGAAASEAATIGAQGGSLGLSAAQKR